MGVKPLSYLRRKLIGPILAVAASAGVGAATGIAISKAQFASASAGVGAATGIAISNAQSVSASAGVGAATGTLLSLASSVSSSSGAGTATATSISKSSSVAASAGAGTALAFSISTTASVASSAGVGVASGVLRATTVSVGFAAGVGSASSTDSPASVAYAAGTSQAFAVSYAFFGDAERECIHQELRSCVVDAEYRIGAIQFDPLRHPDDPIIAAVQAENRTAIILFEDRVYEIDYNTRTAGTPNRKRTC